MPKRGFKEYLRIFLFSLGILFILDSNATITGAVIGTTVSSSLNILLGLIALIASFTLTKEKTTQERIEDIIKEYEHGELDAIHTANALNEIVAIQNIRYREGKQHTILGEKHAYPLPKKNGIKAEELAMAEYLLASKNNPRGTRQNNLEFRKGLSTKHYAEAFRREIEKYKMAHRQELEAILGIA